MGRNSNRKMVKEYQQPIHRRGNAKASCMESCPNSSVMRAVQTQTRRCHFTPMRLTKSLGSRMILCWQGHEEIEELVHVRRFLVHVALLESKLGVFSLILLPSNPFLGVYSKNSRCEKRYGATRVFIIAGSSN